ncbi:MAG: helix-turn-helix domain-containing protein [Bryobacteraceae bacterium]|nr:helix-turn-helix domain-containing protein [Bryobacteraceae bacterium]
MSTTDQQNQVIQNYGKDKQFAAKFLGISEAHINRLVCQRRIPFRKVGKLVRFSVSDLITYWESLPGSESRSGQPDDRRQVTRG